MFETCAQMVSFFPIKNTAIAFTEAQSALGIQGREDLTGHQDWTLHTQSYLARDWGEGHSKQRKSHEQQQCKDEAQTRRTGRTENDPMASFLPLSLHIT